MPSTRRLLPLALAALTIAAASPLLAGETAKKEAPQENGFKPLFNGKNLDGWVRINVDPDTFTVQDGMIHSTGEPTGVMRTEEMYENFILELDWRHLKPKGNAGVFIWGDGVLAEKNSPFPRGTEVQILDGRETENYTSHGDVFPIRGATFVPNRPHPNGWMRCLPSEKRCNPSPEWNHYRIECRDGRITLAVNGKVVSGGHDTIPRKGYICLESEGSPVDFRNIRIKVLPSTNPTPEEVAVPAPREEESGGGGEGEK